jgi:hypothetical protein
VVNRYVGSGRVFGDIIRYIEVCQPPAAPALVRRREVRRLGRWLRLYQAADAANSAKRSWAAYVAVIEPECQRTFAQAIGPLPLNQSVYRIIACTAS